MAVEAIIVFSIALTGTLLLFVLKWLEIERGVMLVPPAWRHYADEYARYAKLMLLVFGERLERLPGESLFIAQALLHFSARQFARLAEAASRRAHRIADFASHKHRFERRETRSDFFQQMSEHKINRVERKE